MGIADCRRAVAEGSEKAPVPSGETRQGTNAVRMKSGGLNTMPQFLTLWLTSTIMMIKNMCHME